MRNSKHCRWSSKTPSLSLLRKRSRKKLLQNPENQVVAENGSTKSRGPTLISEEGEHDKKSTEFTEASRRKSLKPEPTSQVKTDLMTYNTGIKFLFPAKKQFIPRKILLNFNYC